MTDLDALRFWVKVSPVNDCWLWVGYISPGGYGKFRYRNESRLAHRVAYEWAYGAFDDRLCVCHSCDVRNCVNPKHLFLGTHADNLRDMRAKGRANYPKGERHPRAKLTAADVIAIRASHAEHPVPHQELATQYGVKSPQICNILVGRYWKHLLEERT